MIQTRSFHRPALYVAIACASSALIGRAARLKDYGRPTPSRRELSPALLVSRSIRRPVGHRSVTSPSPRIHCSTGRLGHVVRPASCVPDIFAGAYLRCRPVTHLSAIDANGSLERGLGFEHCPTVTLNNLWRWPAPLAVCWRSSAWLVPHNCALPGRHHALIAHGLVIADRLPFSDHATRPAVGRGPPSTHHAIVLGDRHDRSVLTEGGQPMAFECPATALSEEG